MRWLRRRRRRALHSRSTALSSGTKPSVTDKPLVELPTNESNPDLLRSRHTLAHVMAMAVQRLHPRAKIGLGPWTDTGFYYDFQMPDDAPLQEADLPAIEKEMKKIIKADMPVTCEEVSAEEARRRIAAQDEPFKAEILERVAARDDEPVTIYNIGDEWWDLCAGPHAESTGALPRNSFSLEAIAGSYWRGDEKAPSMQRVTATAWQDKAQMKEHRRRVQEAKLRDHRVLGKTLDLFSIQEQAGGGLVFWHPRGAFVRGQIEAFWSTEHANRGYERVVTPHIADAGLWETSGHAGFYADGMFDEMHVEGAAYRLRPMNCPFHCLLFQRHTRSYRDLPMRLCELGTVYRFERSGTLHGLFRARGFTQDDAHIFCLPEQLEDELVGVLDLTEAILSRFGFKEYVVSLSTRPDKSVGSDAVWERAEGALAGALRRKGWDFGIDQGDGAFYGPKIDVQIRDALGRLWQCSTIQLDFNLPERFGLEYKTSAGDMDRPVMIHRAVFGSLERFFGVLTESTEGRFPMWLAPVQLRLIPIHAEYAEACEELVLAARAAGVRAEVDTSSQRLAKRIRNAERERVALIGVVGDEEAKAGSIAVRTDGIGSVDAKRLFAAIADVAGDYGARGIGLQEALVEAS